MPMVCDPWPVDATCLHRDWPADPAQWDPAQKQAVAVASEILRRLTAGVYGLCTLKVRPCRQGCSDRFGVMDHVLAPMGGWARLLGCGCRGSCGCSSLCEIVLDPGVHEIVEVRLDGQVLPASAYRVDDGRRLVRVDGGCWPDCQELGRPDSEPGTFAVTYRTGVPVPAGGRMAVAELAVQLWKACRGGGKSSGCALPERVTSVVREGITYTLLDNLDVFERGRTGLSRVDLWLASVNPYAARAPMRVFSPDTIRHRRTTWPVQALPGGPPDAGAGGSFVFTQTVPSAIWMITHPLGFYPGGVQVIDSTGTEVVGLVAYPAVNVVRIEFSGPVSGVAYLS